MSYQAFATLYDRLMADAPYDEWVTVLKRALAVDSLQGVSLLDVGCGTGELLVRLANQGADVTGVDLSNEMLVVAREKCMAAGVSPLLLHQDMRDLEVLGEFDAVTVFCDSLNYLETEKSVLAAFASLHKQLTQNGLLLFDVHSTTKMEQGFIGQTFADADEEISYIWHSFEGEHLYSVEHELTFFVRSEEGTYHRYDELHKQRTFSVEQYVTWLEEAGFSLEGVTADFGEEHPTDESERIFIVARKK
ncbi:class I SAM-dependent DNA methyltransferase [Bacillus sp. FJAT-45037]|uniref:class I SAM-dependent DNA methyltransferase n=1 Tax=Bacillus sp. FJAT-45037 TaxID=2011007 RepID=UPI000C24EBE8|nr:class I SAM-dependent methyltransferase [Bacillus sp. FJAT-45037]